MPTATFAQICQNLATVEDSSATVFDLYEDVSNNDPSGIEWCISKEDFLNMFYDQGLFRIRDCCDNVMLLHHWIVDPSGDISNNAVPFGSDPSNCHLLSLIEEQWILDASNNCGLDISANWGTCSKMGILGELLKARSLCNWDCKVCCALSAQELADVLNYQELDSSGAWTGDFIRTAENPVTLGDTLILSVLFTNQNPCVDPIELRLHFIIFTSCTISSVWQKTDPGTRPANINPLGGLWAATEIPLAFPPTETSTIATNEGGTLIDFKIKINTIDCCGTSFSDLLVPGLWKGRMIQIKGVAATCQVSDGVDINITYHIDTHTVDTTDNFAIFTVTFVASGTPGANFVPFLGPRAPHHTITLFPFL